MYITILRRLNMSLLREHYTPQSAEVKPTEPTEHEDMVQALLSLGGELVRTTCGVADLRKIQSLKGGTWITERAYHFQDDLPPDHEVAIWAVRERRNFQLRQQVVRWEYRGDEDFEVGVTDPRTVVERRDGAVSLPSLPGVDPSTPHDRVTEMVRDTHETVNFFARALGCNPRPIEY
jgi:hypothetical protein